MFSKKSIFLISILALALFFSGCATIIVKQIEEMEKQQEKAKQERKIYRSANRTFKPENISKIIQNDSTFVQDEIIKTENFPVLLDLIHIDDKEFPQKITLKAVVTDTNGNYIKGLAKPYFTGKGRPEDYWIKLTDSCKGNKNEISDFQIREIRQDIAEPFAIHFVLDHSPSMTHQKALYLQKTLKSVLFAVKENDLVAITKFSRLIHKEVPFSDKKSEYIDNFTVDGLDGNYGDGTSYYDAMIYAIKSFEEVPDSFRKVIVSFTDGEDNKSNADADSVKLLSRERDVTIYSIAYGYADKIIKEIAEYSGGRYYFILSSREFPYVFRDIYLLLNNYYEITYNPPDCKDLHTVNLNLTFPDVKMEYLSDTGYYDKSMFSPMDPVGTKAIVNIEFDYNSAEIKEESYYILDDIAVILKRNPNLKLKITGHTDTDGDEKYNMDLSLKRAENVKLKLTELGIERKRLEIEGKGESDPLVPNTTEDNKRKNRRTELEIIE